MTDYMTKEGQTTEEKRDPCELTVHTFLDKNMLRQMPDSPAMMAMVMNNIERIAEQKLRYLVQKMTGRQLPKWERGKLAE